MDFIRLKCYNERKQKNINLDWESIMKTKLLSICFLFIFIAVAFGQTASQQSAQRQADYHTRQAQNYQRQVLRHQRNVQRAQERVIYHQRRASDYERRAR